MRVIQDEQVEAATRALLGAIDAGDGGTVEQRGVLGAIVGLLGPPRSRPERTRAARARQGRGDLFRAGRARRCREFMVLLELCRHPLTDEQVTRVDAYADAMGEDGPGLRLARTLVRDGTARALADYQRFSDAARVHWAEPSLVDQYLRVLDEPDPELAARLTALHDLPEGTLGWEYVEFYRRQGLALPGVDTFIPAFFVAHDMNHVIAGYGTTGQEETALGDDPRPGRHRRSLGAAPHEHGGLRAGPLQDRHVRGQGGRVWRCEGAAAASPTGSVAAPPAATTSPRSTTWRWPICPWTTCARGFGVPPVDRDPPDARLTRA